ncbi:MAG: 5'-3' exonuclease H3TH domain-containing protein [Candidatus Nealsonbacteria bacterium]|nr:5'-3' exonuclease H3TH domain-containing protein [Candidatus Nealsonbacteria bacterium]
MDKKCLIVIDSNSVIHRAFHALPPLTTQKGEVVGAVYGFLLVFLKAVKEFQPDFVAACFDVKGPTFRHDKYKQYKAKRPPAPDALYQQIPKVKEVLKSFGVSIFEKQGFEGDDVIGTIARIAPKKQVLPELETIIISGDSDNLQLIDQKTKVYVLRKGVKDTVLYDKNLVAQKYNGLIPGQLIDFRALRGDPTDNIPGVSGIGEKTAIELLKEYGSLENIYENIALIAGKTREKLINHKEDAFFSKDLSTIYRSVPIEFNLQECRWENYDKERAAKALKDLEFFSLIPRLP